MNIITLEHQDARINIEEIDAVSRRIRVEMKNSAMFSPRKQWVTRYPVSLIEAVLQHRGPAYLCDEIARDEDPSYTASDIMASVFGYVSKSAMDGKRLLDFGCGSGASTMIMARALPKCQIYGVELEPKPLALARLRAAHYRCDNLTLLQSPSPDALPPEIQQVDYILLSAVYEHLLPVERPRLLRQMWDLLAPGGVLFINQTPDDRFPLETHTTSLPFINYLPDSLAGAFARTCSKRSLKNASWELMLRKGIRGASPGEIMGILSSFSSGSPQLLQPQAPGLKQQSDIWYHSARERLSQRYHGAKRLMILSLIDAMIVSRLPVAPYLSLAIQKQA